MILAFATSTTGTIVLACGMLGMMLWSFRKAV